jgi:hypothetical protein
LPRDASATLPEVLRLNLSPRPLARLCCYSLPSLGAYALRWQRRTDEHDQAEGQKSKGCGSHGDQDSKELHQTSLLPVYKVLYDPYGTVRHDRTRMLRTIAILPHAPWCPLGSVPGGQGLCQVCAPGIVQKPYRVLNAQRASLRPVIVCSPSASCPAYIIPSRAKKVHQHPRECPCTSHRDSAPGAWAAGDQAMAASGYGRDG